MKARRSQKPSVLYTTLWPHDAGARCEQEITEHFIEQARRHESDFDFRVLIVSAHEEPIRTARRILRKLKAEGRCVHISTHYTGTRPEEISFCKETLARMLYDEPCEYIACFDADVWTPLERLPEWIDLIGDDTSNTFVKVKYCLRDQLNSPVHTLGAFFHHRDFLVRHQYWTSIFPRRLNGERVGAPDCNLHYYLAARGCRKIVPSGMFTYHFLDRERAHACHAEKCFLVNDVRKNGKLVFSSDSHLSSVNNGSLAA